MVVTHSPMFRQIRVAGQVRPGNGSSVELGTVVQEPLRRARLARRAQLGALRVDQDQVGVGHLLAQAQAQLLRLADREAAAVDRLGPAFQFAQREPRHL